MSTEYLLAVIADQRTRRRDVADMYAIGLWQHLDTMNWVRVNAAIMHRWEKSALQWIKREAWKERARLVELAESVTVRATSSGPAPRTTEGAEVTLLEIATIMEGLQMIQKAPDEMVLEWRAKEGRVFFAAVDKLLEDWSGRSSSGSAPHGAARNAPTNGPPECLHV